MLVGGCLCVCACVCVCVHVCVCACVCVCEPTGELLYRNILGNQLKLVIMDTKTKWKRILFHKQPQFFLYLTSADNARISFIRGRESLTIPHQAALVQAVFAARAALISDPGRVRAGHCGAVHVQGSTCHLPSLTTQDQHSETYPFISQNFQLPTIDISTQNIKNLQERCTATHATNMHLFVC